MDSQTLSAEEHCLHLVYSTGPHCCCNGFLFSAAHLCLALALGHPNQCSHCLHWTCCVVWLDWLCFLLIPLVCKQVISQAWADVGIIAWWCDVTPMHCQASFSAEPVLASCTLYRTTLFTNWFLTLRCSYVPTHNRVNGRGAHFVFVALLIITS